MTLLALAFHTSSRHLVRSQLFLAGALRCHPLIGARPRSPQQILPFFPAVPLLKMAHNGIQYSERYYDDVYEYRHVVLPQDIAKRLPKNRLLSEAEWRNLGVCQSRGWVHYAIHRPEPHIMLFRRPKGYGQPAGQPMVQ